MKKIIDYIKKNYVAFTIFLVLLFVIILIVIFINLFSTSSKEKSYKTLESMYQYFEKSKTSFIAEVVYTDNRILGLSSSEYNIYDDAPVYFRESKSLVIPKDYEMYFYISGNRFKLDKYTKVYENKDITYVWSNKEIATPYNFFLYDLKDSYIIFEEATLKIDKKEVKLSPFSYIDANSMEVKYYDFDSDKMEIVSEFKNLSLELNGSKIDLINDVIKYNEKLNMLPKKSSDVLYMEDKNE